MSTKKPFLIGIAGGSGSGKTTFIRKLRSFFPEKELCILSLDNYYKPRELQGIDAQGVRNFDRPESIDLEGFMRDLNALLNGESVTIREYTFNNALTVPRELTFYTAPVVIVEGLFIYHFEELRALFDLKCFVEADDILKLIRRIQRDQSERNYPLDDVLYRYQHHVKPSYEQYILPYQKDVDLIINNHDTFEQALRIFHVYIKSIIQERAPRQEVKG
jgi:uridine kinase